MGQEGGGPLIFIYSSVEVNETILHLMIRGEAPHHPVPAVNPGTDSPVLVGRFPHKESQHGRQRDGERGGARQRVCVCVD